MTPMTLSLTTLAPPPPDSPLWKDILQVLHPGTPYQNLVPSEAESEELGEIIQVCLDFFFSDPLYELPPYSALKAAMETEVEKAHCAHLAPVADSSK